VCSSDTRVNSNRRRNSCPSACGRYIRRITIDPPYVELGREDRRTVFSFFRLSLGISPFGVWRTSAERDFRPPLACLLYPTLYQRPLASVPEETPFWMPLSERNSWSRPSATRRHCGHVFERVPVASYKYEQSLQIRMCTNGFSLLISFCRPIDVLGLLHVPHGRGTLHTSVFYRRSNTQWGFHENTRNRYNS